MQPFRVLFGWISHDILVLFRWYSSRPPTELKNTSGWIQINFWKHFRYSCDFGSLSSRALLLFSNNTITINVLCGLLPFVQSLHQKMNGYDTQQLLYFSLMVAPPTPPIEGVGIGVPPCDSARDIVRHLSPLISISLKTISLCKEHTWGSWEVLGCTPPHHATWYARICKDGSWYARMQL